VHLPDRAQKNRHNIRRGIRTELGFSETDLVLVFASMNFEIKGLDEILLSLARLDRQSGFKMVVAGKGDIKKYEKLAADAGIADRVIFTGVVGKDRLEDFYLAGDAYIMLSKFDTFGMVVLEAMAAGLPVIVSDHVGAKDLVEEGVNGFVVADASDCELVASRIRLLFDPECRRNMSEAAWATAAQNTWDQTVRKYADLYKEILERKNR